MIPLRVFDNRGPAFPRGSPKGTVRVLRPALTHEGNVMGQLGFTYTSLAVVPVTALSGFMRVAEVSVAGNVRPEPQ